MKALLEKIKFALLKKCIKLSENENFINVYHAIYIMKDLGERIQNWTTNSQLINCLSGSPH